MTFAKHVLHQIRTAHDDRGPFETLSRSLATDLFLSNRQGVLDGAVWPLLMPVYRLLGCGALAAMIEAIDDFDGQAGAKLSAAATASPALAGRG